MSNKPLPSFRSDEEAERFVDEADLSEYDLSGGSIMHFTPRPPQGQGVASLTLPDADLETAKRNANAEGVPLNEYLGRLVHESLERLAS